VKKLFRLIFTAVGDGNIHLFINRWLRIVCGECSGCGECCGCGGRTGKLFYTIYRVVEATVDPV